MNTKDKVNNSAWWKGLSQSFKIPLTSMVGHISFPFDDMKLIKRLDKVSEIRNNSLKSARTNRGPCCGIVNSGCAVCMIDPSQNISHGNPYGKCWLHAHGALTSMLMGFP